MEPFGALTVRPDALCVTVRPPLVSVAMLQNPCVALSKSPTVGVPTGVQAIGCSFDEPIVELGGRGGPGGGNDGEGCTRMTVGIIQRACLPSSYRMRLRKACDVDLTNPQDA